MLTFALALLSLLAATPQSTVATFRGDSSHSGVYSSQPPALRTTVWKFKTGGKVISSPVVSGGLVFVGSNDGKVYALNAADGTMVWKYQTGLAVMSSPAVADGVVYILSRDGNLYALTADTGALKWKFATAGEQRFTARGIHGIPPSTETMPDPFDAFLSSPTVVGGRVYFGSGDHNVYAVDAATGAKVWAFPTGDVVHTSAAVADGTVYIGSFDRHMYALDAATGALKWKFQTGDDQVIHNQIGITSSAAVAGDALVFGCRDGHFYALERASGKLRWAENNQGGWVIASPAVKGGVVYFPTSDGTLFKAIDIATGHVRWRVKTPAVSFSSPAIAGTLAYFGTHDGWVRALDLATGDVKYAFQTDGNKQYAATYVQPDGTLNMRAIYLQPGLEGTFAGIDRMHLLGSVLSSPSIVDGVLYVGSTDGYVYAVR